MNVRRLTVTGAASALLLGLTALPASADPTTASGSPSPSPSATVTTTRVLSCARAEKTITRLTKAETLIQGSASTKGSVAWLDAKAAAARAAGHDAAATRVQQRADRREKRLPTIESTLSELKQAYSASCAAPSAS